MSRIIFKRKELYIVVSLGVLMSCSYGLEEIGVYSEKPYQYPNYCDVDGGPIGPEYLDDQGNPTSMENSSYCRWVYCIEGELVAFPWRSYRHAGVFSETEYDSLNAPNLMNGEYTLIVDYNGESLCFQKYAHGFLLESKQYNSVRDTFIFEYYNWQTMQSQIVGIGRWGDTLLNLVTFADSGLVGSWEEFYGDSIMSYGVAPDSVMNK
ncbi:MAG: hypothetical protein HWE14_12760 [Flavobacteriia bacterium]|nr:hypothetical protein [Flavobacteriia bacterium]